MSDIRTRDHAEVVAFIDTLDKMLKGLEQLFINQKPTLNGERYMTDRELSDRLKISTRTLQTWRDTGKIDYIKLDGKILYAESAIQKVLDSHYVKAWDS